MSKILIVDDNVNACYLLKSFLEDMDGMDGMDHDIIVSYNGKDALEKVKNLKPDIMLLNIIMEDIDGMEILRRIRQFDKRIGIIMTSTLIDEEICRKALENGADDYITNPFDFDHMNECISAVHIKKNKEKQRTNGNKSVKP